MKFVCLLSLFVFAFPLFSVADEVSVAKSANLQGRDGTKISISFVETQYSNGGSSTVNFLANKIQINVTTGNCQAANITGQLFGRLANGTDITQTVQFRNLSPCVYVGTPSFNILTKSFEEGRRLNYQQDLKVQVNGNFVIDPMNGSDTFILNLGY